MKHINLFENFNNSYEDNNKKDYFWKIHTDPIRYRYVIKTLGLEVQNIDGWLSTDYSGEGEYMYLSRSINIHNGKTYFGWMRNNKNGYDYYNKRGYKYMGELEIPEYLISQDKYNL